MGNTGPQRVAYTALKKSESEMKAYLKQIAISNTAFQIVVERIELYFSLYQFTLTPQYNYKYIYDVLYNEWDFRYIITGRRDAFPVKTPTIKNVRAHFTKILRLLNEYRNTYVVEGVNHAVEGYNAFCVKTVRQVLLFIIFYIQQIDVQDQNIRNPAKYYKMFDVPITQLWNSTFCKTITFSKYVKEHELQNYVMSVNTVEQRTLTAFMRDIKQDMGLSKEVKPISMIPIPGTDRPYEIVVVTTEMRTLILKRAVDTFNFCSRVAIRQSSPEEVKQLITWLTLLRTTFKNSLYDNEDIFVFRGLSLIVDNINELIRMAEDISGKKKRAIPTVFDMYCC